MCAADARDTGHVDEFHLIGGWGQRDAGELLHHLRQRAPAHDDQYGAARVLVQGARGGRSCGRALEDHRGAVPALDERRGRLSGAPVVALIHTIQMSGGGSLRAEHLRQALRARLAFG